MPKLTLRRFEGAPIPPGFSLRRARALQARLAGMASCRDELTLPIRYVGGVDVAYKEDRSIGGAAVLRYDTLELVEVKTATTGIFFPYAPTLLSFREVPPIVKAIGALRNRADVYLVDGQGILHPYGCGLATHLGVVLDVASVGVAKSRLCGEVAPFTPEGWAPVLLGGRVAGAALKVPGRKRPLFVSVGHKVTLRTSIEIVRRCITSHAIPEPIWHAHVEVNKAKRTSSEC